MSNKFLNQVSKTINSIIDIIKNPKLTIENCSYYYDPEARINLIIYLYLFKVLINKKEYLEQKYQFYLKRYNRQVDLKEITNIEAENELEVIFKIQEYFPTKQITNKKNVLYFDTYHVKVSWLLEFLNLLLGTNQESKTKTINICYAIPNKDITKVTEKNKMEDFLQEFTLYNIKISHNKAKDIKENSILIVKNAAINYLKHLKQYKHQLENEESYIIFYKLLKEECKKQEFVLEEEETKLIEADEKYLNKIYNSINDDFYDYQLSKQVHVIESLMWQYSNDQSLIENTNNTIEQLIELLSLFKNNPKKAYSEIKPIYVNDIHIVSLLTVNLFIVTYLKLEDEIDYSLLDLSKLKPKYMNSICSREEQDIKIKLKSYDIELNSSRISLEKYKKRRQEINKLGLSEEQYKKELEQCVGDINRVSIIIARLNSSISSFSHDYEKLKKEQKEKYKNVDLYNNNHSIIKHMCNSILGCSYYLKTNNNKALFNNVIIFEDYEKTDNSFYLEVTIRDLLKISSQSIINGVIDQNDLPKLA